jgi:hypothetical protein
MMKSDVKKTARSVLPASDENPGPRGVASLKGPAMAGMGRTGRKPPSENLGPRSLPRKAAGGSRNAKPRLESGRREKLLGEIEGMLDVLTEDGLSHVLAIATMCRYELALVRSEESRLGGRNIQLESSGASVRIERSSDGATYHLISGKAWKILAAEEIAALVRISRGAEDTLALAQLYDWLQTERRDIAIELHVRSDKSPALLQLLGLLRETFPVRSPRRVD